jgi:hypothetical protein
MWITRPQASGTASCNASEIVGCGKTVFITSSSVVSSVRASAWSRIIPARVVCGATVGEVAVRPGDRRHSSFTRAVRRWAIETP